MKHTVFAVEDDVSLQEVYRYSLENDFICRCFDDGDSFFEAIAKRSIPDLVLLDIMLPGDDGFAILTRLKKNNSTADIPVIMVSAKGEEASKVRGLNLGADDYIAKPFSILELIARINANLRKSGKETAWSVVYKDITVDSDKHEITTNGKPIRMTLKEYNLMNLLCKNAGKVQLRSDIFNEVWQNDFLGETRTLDIHIKELRKKLSDAKSEVQIKTVRGVGYMLT